MKIGNIIINRSSKIRKILLKKPSKSMQSTWQDLMQIYSCRIFGFCVYRDLPTYRKEYKKIIAEQRGL